MSHDPSEIFLVYWFDADLYLYFFIWIWIWCCIFEQINAALVSIRDFFRTHKKILIQIVSVQSQMNTRQYKKNNNNEGNIYLLCA